MFEISDIQMIDWQQIEPEPLGGDLAEDLCSAMNKSIKYGLTLWWNKRGFKKEKKEEYLSMKGAFDKAVRPAIYLAKTTATAIKFSVFDESAADIKEYIARDKYIKLLRSCALKHIGNSEGGWGASKEYLSAVYELVFTAWLVWEKLNIRDKNYIINIINTELKVAMAVEPEYNFALDGSCRDDGESKTIANMEYANLLYLVSVMACRSYKSEECRQKAIRLYRACFASRQDCDMGGFNVDADWKFCQYGGASPLATSYLGVGIKAYIISKLSEEYIPSGVTRSFEEIYKAFYSYIQSEGGVKHGEFTIYDKKNRPCSGVKYPDGVKGGKANESAFYAMDIFAFCLGFEDIIDIPSREWAKTRMKTIEKKLQKHGKYCVQGSNRFRNIHGEAVCSELANSYMALFAYIVTKKAEVIVEQDAFSEMEE